MPKLTPAQSWDEALTPLTWPTLANGALASNPTVHDLGEMTEDRLREMFRKKFGLGPANDAEQAEQDGAEATGYFTGGRSQ